MVRDALSMCGIDSEFDFSKRGEGEKALIHKISVDIENGYKGWWNPDIKDCFGSIRPGHFGWLPIDRRVIKNVFFVPECAGVIVKVKAEEAKALLLSVGWSPYCRLLCGRTACGAEYHSLPRPAGPIPGLVTFTPACPSGRRQGTPRRCR